ncbi:MAG: class I SAM-dependent methyltransferase [Rhodospirillaceae bacterium]
MTPPQPFGVFGAPPQDVAAVPADAVQFSPVVPGARSLEEAAPGSLSGVQMAAPPGTLERRYALASALRALAPGAPLTVSAPKSKGGGRIAEELVMFGCAVDAESRRHQRICRTARPAHIGGSVDEAIAAGALRFDAHLGLWTQPGIFSWDRIDAGTAVLLSVLPSFEGRGADLGCGLGIIAKAVLASRAVTQLDLVDIDRRAIAAARQNVTDARARFHWADARDFHGVSDADFVVMNPPFHDGGMEDRALGAAFVRRARKMLRGGGTVWLVANRHLPYESVLTETFAKVSLRADEAGYKVYEAQT